MKALFSWSRWLVGVTGGIEVVLGVLLWVGLAQSLAYAYVVIGAVFAISLAVLALLAAKAGAPRRTVIVSIITAFLFAMPILVSLGLAGAGMVPAMPHWFARAAHLFLALFGMGLGAKLAVTSDPRKLAGPQGPDPRSLDPRKLDPRKLARQV